MTYLGVRNEEIFDGVWFWEAMEFLVRITKRPHGRGSDEMSKANKADDVVPCPFCGGSGKVFATGIIYAEGHSGPHCKWIPCFDCNGERVVSAERLMWIERGEAVRKWRRSSELTLRDAAERAGVRPSEVSHLEQGRVDNSDWRSILKAE